MVCQIKKPRKRVFTGLIQVTVTLKTDNIDCDAIF